MENTLLRKANSAAACIALLKPPPPPAATARPASSPAANGMWTLRAEHTLSNCFPEAVAGTCHRCVTFACRPAAAAEHSAGRKIWECISVHHLPLHCPFKSSPPLASGPFAAPAGCAATPPARVAEPDTDAGFSFTGGSSDSRGRAGGADAGLSSDTTTSSFSNASAYTLT